MPRKPSDTLVPFGPRIPDDWALDTAIEWLRLNEGTGGEKEACHVLADWVEAITGLRQRWPKPCNHDPEDEVPQ